MGESNRLIRLVLLVTGAAIVAVAIAQLRAKREAVEVTAQRIHDQLDELDPVTRERGHRSADQRRGKRCRGATRTQVTALTRST
jgi:hypothetical protein